MFYLLDSVGRIIVRGDNENQLRLLAERIALAGAMVYVAKDIDKPKPLGKSEAWRIENDIIEQTPIERLEQIVGKVDWNEIIGPEGTVPHG